MDNAHNTTQIRPLLPGDGRCGVIVTSRSALGGLAGAVSVNLTALEETEALDLLAEIVGGTRPNSSPADAVGIVHLCGYLPLAIRIAGAQLRGRPLLTLADYRTRLADEHRRLEILQIDDLSVRASLNLTYRDLDVDHARLFRFLSLIPEVVFNDETAQCLLGETYGPLETQLALEFLEDFRLLEPVGSGRHRFHDLVRLFAAEKLQEEEAGADRYRAIACLDVWYLQASSAHFYAQAVVLDRYVHAASPLSSPDIVKAILEVLQDRSELRRYFFRSQPSAAWASIFWNNEFFCTAPMPEENDDGVFLPRWEALDHLVGVASEVPELVVKVAQTIDTDQSAYLSRLLQAITAIPMHEAQKLVPSIVGWLDRPYLAGTIGLEALKLIKLFEESGYVDDALRILQSVLTPIAPQADERASSAVGGESRSKFGREASYELDQVIEGLIPPLARRAPDRLAEVLEAHLCEALRLEADFLNRPDHEA